MFLQTKQRNTTIFHFPMKLHFPWFFYVNQPICQFFWLALGVKKLIRCENISMAYTIYIAIHKGVTIRSKSCTSLVHGVPDYTFSLTTVPSLHAELVSRGQRRVEFVDSRIPIPVDQPSCNPSRHLYSLGSMGGILDEQGPSVLISFLLANLCWTRLFSRTFA